MGYSNFLSRPLPLCYLTVPPLSYVKSQMNGDPGASLSSMTIEQLREYFLPGRTLNLQVTVECNLSGMQQSIYDPSYTDSETGSGSLNFAASIALPPPNCAYELAFGTVMGEPGVGGSLLEDGGFPAVSQAVPPLTALSSDFDDAWASSHNSGTYKWTIYGSCGGTAAPMGIQVSRVGDQAYLTFSGITTLLNAHGTSAIFANQYLYSNLTFYTGTPSNLPTGPSGYTAVTLGAGTILGVPISCQAFNCSFAPKSKDPNTGQTIYNVSGAQTFNVTAASLTLD